MTDMRDAIVVLLAGGQGERLWPLTRDRAKARRFLSAPLTASLTSLSPTASTPISAAFSSFTQYKALSLSRHVRAGWSSIVGLGEFMKSFRPNARQQRVVSRHRRRRLSEHLLHRSERSKHVFILSGDHIYKMNYAKMLQQHLDFAADVTVGTIQIPVGEAAHQFGVIRSGQRLAHHRF